MALVVVLIPLAVIGFFLSRAYAEVDEDFVHVWARGHGLRLTTANRPLVWWYLRNARVLRTWGVMAGVVLPPLLSLALGLGEQGFRTTFWCIFAGHLAGTLYAEITLRRPTPSGTRVATLDRRELRQYLPARLRFAPLGVTVLTAVLVAAGVSTGELTSATERQAVVTAVAAAIVIAGIALAQRWVVRRPQPFTEDELVAADDAIRSQSVHMLAGSGTAVLLAVYAELLNLITIDTSPKVSTVVGVVGFLFAPAAIVACLYYGHRAWSVRRGPLWSAVGAP